MLDVEAETPKPRNNSSSLRRALAIILYLGEGLQDRRGATLSDLAKDLGLSKSTLIRLIAPLREVRLIEQDPGTGRYRLGWRAAQLGQVYLDQLDLRTTAHDVLVQLTRDSGETTHLVVPDFPDVVYVDKVEAAHPVRMYSRVGARQPAYCTGVGKALLAYSDEEQLESVIRSGLPRRTAHTLTTERALRKDLSSVRNRGYAVDNIENEADVRCVAAPVFDHTRAAVCAVSISGPAGRVTEARIPHLGHLVTFAADEISRRLGAPR